MIDFDVEYAYSQYCETEGEYFDENGRAYTNTNTYLEMEEMRDLIHGQMSYIKDQWERIKMQVDTNDRLLLELKESTQRILQLENELNEINSAYEGYDF